MREEREKGVEREGEGKEKVVRERREGERVEKA